MSFSNWRVLVSVLVAMGLLAISFAPNIGNLQIPSLGLACCLLGATGILGGTEFREYGIMAGGVLIPWSRVKRVTWIDHGNASTMWVKAAGCFPLAVRVSAVNKHAVDRLVHSAARYERFPVAYWLGNLVTRSVIAILVAVGVLAILV